MQAWLHIIAHFAVPAFVAPGLAKASTGMGLLLGYFGLIHGD